MERKNHPADRRTLRTRRVLKESLFALILEKGYDSVTIEEITSRANLGRTTFYLHYHDKEELLVESIETIASDLIARLPQPSWTTEQPALDPIQFTFEHAGENAQLYRIILRGEGSSVISGRIHAIICRKTTELVEEYLRANQEGTRLLVPVEIYANYFAGALLALVTWWLEAGMPYAPADIAAMFRQLFDYGSQQTLGIVKNQNGL